VVVDGGDGDERMAAWRDKGWRVEDATLGPLGVAQAIAASLLSETSEAQPPDAPWDDGVSPGKMLDVDDVTDAAFAAMPLVIRGHSKEVRYAGNGLVVIKLLPTIYSFTHNRAATVEGSDVLRLRSAKILVQVLQQHGVSHAYLQVGTSFILSRLVLPCAAEFKQYNCEVFHPPDLSPAQLAQLPRAPPIEVIIKTFHGGTSKLRYKGMHGSSVRPCHAQHQRGCIRDEEPYPSPMVRFDWRNPLDQRHADVKGPDGTAREMLEQCMETADTFRPRMPHDDSTLRKVSEALGVILDPATARVADEIMPEPLADYFINTAMARQTALNLCHNLPHAATLHYSCTVVHCAWKALQQCCLAAGQCSNYMMRRVQVPRDADLPHRGRHGLQRPLPHDHPTRRHGLWRAEPRLRPLPPLRPRLVGQGRLAKRRQS